MAKNRRHQGQATPPENLDRLIKTGGETKSSVEMQLWLPPLGENPANPCGLGVVEIAPVVAR
jgi:hypothetical protein